MSSAVLRWSAKDLLRSCLASLVGLCLLALGEVVYSPPRADAQQGAPAAGRWVSDSDDERRVPGYVRRRFALRTSHRRDNGKMLELVSPLSEPVGHAVVQVISDNKPVCLGTIVSQDGYVLTKRSELSGDPIRVRLPDSRMLAARVSAVRRSNDLALLKVDGLGEAVAAVEFAESEEPPAIGSFLVSVGRGGSPVGLGAVSTGQRRVDHQGRLGLRLDDDSEGRAMVSVVLPASGAAAAGIREGDRIVAIDGHDKSRTHQVINTLRGYFPGESVRLTIRRDETTLNLVAKIKDFSVMQESENDHRVNGPRSVRLNGFERVLQHDTVLNPDECGGPVIDTNGQVVGVNIARAGRVVSYALPAAVIRQDVASMLDEARAANP